MVFDFLQPLSEEVSKFVEQLTGQCLGKKVALHSAEGFPKLSEARIAIIGVLDNRGLDLKKKISLDVFRKQFYSMYPGNWFLPMADLGDIMEGATQEDTYYVVSELTAELIKRKIVPVIIGGSQDLTYAVYRAYDQLDQMVNAAIIDAKFDLGREESFYTAGSYLSKMIINEPNNLFNCSIIGYQTYYNSQEEIDLFEKMFFEVYRLGEVSSDITITEPVFRDMDMVSLDLTSVKSSASGNFVSFAPNGFDGKEICALARYAGISDKVSSFGIFNGGHSSQEAVLISQLVWYFIEGYNYRSGDYPFGGKEQYTKYTVLIDQEELVFYKSHKTDRWWIEIPYIPSVNNKLKRNTLLPCTYEDYLKACDQEIPERWWKAQRKNML